MARAAARDALINDSRLVALGFDGASILANYDGDQRPSETMFMVLSWGPEAAELRGDDYVVVKSRPLEIWIHMYREWSTDFSHVDNVIKIIDDIMLNMIHVVGSDGEVLVMAEYLTSSRDLRDDTYQTLCRSVSYKILSR